MCGEHLSRPLMMLAPAGSSPHVRGALSTPEVEFPARGIIPACAGSTAPTSCHLRRGRDHPRMCGEHIVQSVTSICAPGSSPHVRGAPTTQGIVGDTYGIIPACAGSTGRIYAGLQQAGDHPRMCGEHNPSDDSHVDASGSSPHVRGAPPVFRPPVSTLGIIPACAGSTAGLAERIVCCRDHPRMCGEHKEPEAQAFVKRGSSPHVRGAPSANAWTSSPRGIIPACAGSTQTRQTRHPKQWDHPRMCGEHASKIA